MLVLALGVANPLTRLGAALFDLTVARDRFVRPGLATRVVGRPLYYTGQCSSRSPRALRRGVALPRGDAACAAPNSSCAAASYTARSASEKQQNTRRSRPRCRA